MGSVFRRVLWFAVITALVYAAYVSYVRWWDKGLTSRVKDSVSGFLGRTSEEVAETVGGAVEERAKEYASSVISGAQDAVARYVRTKAADALVAIGAKITETAETLTGLTSSGFPVGTVPISTGSNFLTPPPPATIVTKVHTPLVFSIANNSSYSISWGDSTSESGTVPASVMQLVSHAWERPGDITVTVTLTSSGKTAQHTFPVRIYE